MGKDSESSHGSLLLDLWRNQHFSIKYDVIQLLSPVRLFATPWTAAHQISLSSALCNVNDSGTFLGEEEI